MPAPTSVRRLYCCAPCHFLPDLEALDHLLSVRPGRKQVAARAKVLRNRTIRAEEALRMPW
jgi:hypothetical protein